MNKTERCVGYYLDEKDANPAFRPDSASLEDGSVLKALLEKFDGRRDDKALYAVMRCLRDSFLYVKSDMSDFLTDRGRRYLKAFAGFKEGKAEKRRALVSELIKAVEANRALRRGNRAGYAQVSARSGFYGNIEIYAVGNRFLVRNPTKLTGERPCACLFLQPTVFLGLVQLHRK